MSSLQSSDRQEASDFDYHTRLRVRFVRALATRPHALLARALGHVGCRIWARCALDRAGLDEVLRLCDRDLEVGCPVARSDRELELLKTAVEAVDATWSWTLGALGDPYDTCLYRAMAMYRLLRRRGFAVTFVVGVRREATGPNGMLDVGHAWVEVDRTGFPTAVDTRPFIVVFRHPTMPASGFD